MKSYAIKDDTGIILPYHINATKGTAILSITNSLGLTWEQLKKEGYTVCKVLVCEYCAKDNTCSHCE